MGEMAELILEGYFCQVCGAVMEDLIVPGQKQLKEAPGHPRTCDDCRRDDKPRPGAWKKKRR